VERISGPKTLSTLGSLVKGKTASFTATPGRGSSSGRANSPSDTPVMTAAASLARGTPVALLTNGIVRDARGFTSSTQTTSFLIPYCTLINPTTPSAAASALV